MTQAAKKGKRLPFEFDCAAWIMGTRGLSVYERGLYIDFLALMYDRGGAIPNDANWIARELSLRAANIRPGIVRLISCGKVKIDGDGNLTNARVANGGSPNPVPNPVPKVEPNPVPNPVPDSVTARRHIKTLSSSEYPTKSLHREGRARASRLLPDDWTPSPKLVELGRSLGFTDSEITGQAERMRNWSLGSGKRKLDWDRTFHNWITSAAERKPKDKRFERSSFTNAELAKAIRPRFDR